MTVSKEQLLKPRLEEADVEIRGVGTVRVRALSRGEIFMMQTRTEGKGTDVKERLILSLGMIDPALTDSEIREWHGAAPAGELDPVVDKIRDLSGLAEGADKSGVPEVRDGAGHGVRALPSDEAGDDGGVDQGDD